jgi:L-ascorbate metabolism protein UlaG (beta-lactamase superfamily)
MKISRRGLIAGGAALAAAGLGLEYSSFQGKFDHRRALGASAADRYAESQRRIDRGAEGVLHIGHSTHLLALGGLRLLTDPWFYDPAFGALAHDVIPAVVPSGLGKLDAILISHDHADHADLRALAEMDKKASVVVATEELAKKVRGAGFSDVSVLALAERKTIGPLTIAAVEAVHDVYEIGFVVTRGDASVYFAGDTALNPAIAKIGQAFKPRLSILPCDGTLLTGGAQLVMTPADAVEAAKRLGSRIVIPSHAEAYFSDPIASTFLASAAKSPRETFAAGVAKDLAGIATCPIPAPGELVML